MTPRDGYKYTALKENAGSSSGPCGPCGPCGPSSEEKGSANKAQRGEWTRAIDYAKDSQEGEGMDRPRLELSGSERVDSVDEGVR